MTIHTESKTVCILTGNRALPTHSAYVILVYCLHTHPDWSQIALHDQYN